MSQDSSNSSGSSSIGIPSTVRFTLERIFRSIEESLDLTEGN
uniref:MarR family transcriptional regulator n=1 Tax=Rodentolepis nana TaxID=102285 RepID=A0A0R3TKS0_RODNA